MAQYDTQTLLIAETYASAVLLQIACDALAEVVDITGDASLLEPFFAQTLANDWSESVEGAPGGQMRKSLALNLLRARLPQMVELMRNYAQSAEKSAKRAPARLS